MVLNKQICEKYGISVEDYRKWCKQHKLQIHNRKNKELFFKELSEMRKKDEN